MSLINATYLVKSKYGVYSFRWSVRLFNAPLQSSLESSKPNKGYTYKQVKISLQTKDYFEAVQRAYPLYTALLNNPAPTYLQVKELFRQYKSNTETAQEALQILSSVKMEEYLQDLSYKSCKEYMSCWDSFLKVEIPQEPVNHSFLNTKANVNANSKVKDIPINILSDYHIELWKISQTCAPKTLKKKLRILSSCFSRASISVNQEWFQLRLAKQDSSSTSMVERRAFTSKCSGQLKLATVLEFSQYSRSDSLGVRPPLY